MEELKKTIFSESLTLSSKQRFGLFSHPVSHAICDDSYDNKAKHPRAQNGKPSTSPKNVITNPAKKGKIRSVYFGVPGSIHIGDAYTNKSSSMELAQSRKKRKSLHQFEMKPAIGHRTLACSSYEYFEEKPENISVKRCRNAEGRVMTEPRNIITNPCSKIEASLWKLEYQSDPYSRKNDIQRETRKIHRLKIKESFRIGFKGKKVFNKDSAVYGNTITVQQGSQMDNKKVQSPIYSNKLKHELDFIPSRAVGGFFGKYPEHSPDKLPIPYNSKYVSKSEREAFKPSRGCQLSRPTPSVILHTLNIRRHLH